MCLAVPGKIIERSGEETGFPVGTVDFQGSTMEVSLALVPDAGVGDWILVHAGFAINRLDEAEAHETWHYLEQAGLVEPPGAPEDPGQEKPHE